MPLRIKCNSCKRTLVLDELFRGGFCRCGYCHTHQRVTYAGRSAPRPAVRPDRPGLRIKALGESHRALPWAAGASIDIQELEPGPTRVSAGWHWASTAVTAAVAVVCGLAWHWSAIGGGALNSRDRMLADAGADSAAVKLAAARVDVDRLLAASNDDDFFGVPVGDEPVGIILDGSDAMTPYSDHVARLAYAARVHVESNDLGFRVIAADSTPDAVSADFGKSNEVDRFFPLAYSQIKRRGSSFESSSASLSDAVAMTDEWRRGKLFVVLAHRLPDDELAALTNAIANRGAPAYVISLGSATLADYASVAAAGNGWTIPVTDASLESLADRCTVEMPMPSK